MAHRENIYNIEGNIRAYKAVIEKNSKSRKRKTKTFNISDYNSKKEAKKEAELWIAKQTIKKENGTLIDPKKITVSQYFEEFLKSKKEDIATTTYDNYEKRYEAHIKPDLGDFLMQKIKPYHLERYFNKKKKTGKIRGKGGLSNNTIKKIFVLMNQCFKKADKFNIIERNPLEVIDCPQPEKKEAEVMKKNEFMKLLKVAKKEDYFMFVFICTILFTGLRKSEALGLGWDQVNLKEKTIFIKRRMIAKRKKGSIIEEKTKNKTSRRKIKISDKLIKELKNYKKWQIENRIALGPEYKNNKIDLVFCKEDGSMYYPNSLNKKMKILNKKADLPYKSKIHILRHTFATINVNNKIGPEIIKNMLGHSTIKTTIDTYYHHDVDQQKEAVDNMEKIINIDG